MRIADRISSMLIIVLGAFIIFGSLKFDYMVDGSPGPGFLPFWVGLAIILVSGIHLLTTLKNEGGASPFASNDFRPFFVYIGGGVLVSFLTPLIGLMIPLGLMVGISSWIMGTKSKKVLIGITVFTPVIMYLIFDLLLGVPIPKGLIKF